MRFLSLVCVVLFGCAAVPTRLASYSATEGQLVGEVNEGNLAALKEKLSNTPDNGRMNIYINSPGGYVGKGLDFLRDMEAAQARGVRLVCTVDFAASMAAVIFSACDIRLAKPRAILMIHSAANNEGGNAREHREAADRLEIVSDALLRQIQRVLNISFRELKARAGEREYWLDAGRAKQIGLVQEILS